MALITRVSRLFRADFNAVLDRIEEPDMLLKQAVREMEDELAHDEQRLKASLELEHERARRGALDRTLAGFEQELDVCFASGEEELARGVLRRRLETQRLGEPARAAAPDDPGGERRARGARSRRTARGSRACGRSRDPRGGGDGRARRRRLDRRRVVRRRKSTSRSCARSRRGGGREAPGLPRGRRRRARRERRGRRVLRGADDAVLGRRACCASSSRRSASPTLVYLLRRNEERVGRITAVALLAGRGDRALARSSRRRCCTCARTSASCGSCARSTSTRACSRRSPTSDSSRSAAARCGPRSTRAACAWSRCGASSSCRRSTSRFPHDATSAKPTRGRATHSRERDPRGGSGVRRCRRLPVDPHSARLLRSERRELEA